MASQPENPNKTMWMLGLAITLPMILLSGPLAGYFLGYFCVKHLEWPGYVTPIFAGLGFFGSGVQCFQLIKKINNADNKK